MLATSPLNGGKAMTWEGKVGLIFASTGAFDRHHSVVSAMGDRYLLCRIAPVEGQFERALKHTGEKTMQMRRELATAVVKLFDSLRSAPGSNRCEPRPLSPGEQGRISRIVKLVVKLRAAVDRDRGSREIEVIYGPEGEARLGLSLERLLAWS